MQMQPIREATTPECRCRYNSF